MAQSKPHVKPKPTPKPVAQDAANKHSVFSLAAKINARKARNKKMLDSIN